jgi:hypothetical protein
MPQDIQTSPLSLDAETPELDALFLVEGPRATEEDIIWSARQDGFSEASAALVAADWAHIDNATWRAIGHVTWGMTADEERAYWQNL